MRAFITAAVILFAMISGPAHAASALIAAAERGDAASVRGAIAAGAPLEERDERQRTALMAAVQGNHIEVARLLIEAKADVNAKDNIQDSPYLLAGARGYLEILRLTLANGADLRSTNRFGGTALIPACERGHVETVKALIEAGIDIDHVNRLGWTGLLEAIILSNGGPHHVEIVRLLIAAKANVNLPDRDGVSPLSHARQRGYREIEQLLVAGGAR
ncbi:MAG: ankyrin repeat domain-containing protein [Alphaproteobacteria bacterium]|nr:ankyrin repeat domain-containing protein [Alphaproteobacteria bacterium]